MGKNNNRQDKVTVAMAHVFVQHPRLRRKAFCSAAENSSATQTVWPFDASRCQAP